MPVNSFSILVAFLLSVPCASALNLSGSEKAMQKQPVAVERKVAGEPKGFLLKIVEQVYDDGWRVAGDVIVTHEGSYLWTVYSLDKKKPSAPEIFTGRLPSSLVQSLRKDVSQKTGLEFVNGIPIYRYGIENHRARHPAGIGKLLRLLKREQEKSKATHPGQSKKGRRQLLES